MTDLHGPISEMQIKCLISLAERSRPNGELCLPFRAIQEDTELSRPDVRRSVRALTRKGFAEFHKGLTTEDGGFAGAGYCISKLGLTRAGMLLHE